MKSEGEGQVSVWSCWNLLLSSIKNIPTFLNMEEAMFHKIFYLIKENPMSKQKSMYLFLPVNSYLMYVLLLCRYHFHPTLVYKVWQKDPIPALIIDTCSNI